MKLQLTAFVDGLCLLVGLGVASAIGAQPADSPTARAEPKVERTVIEDDGARIEELRVRGQTQRIVVSPKRGPYARYEIITGDGSRDLSAGANTSRGAAGQRVWHVLSF
jgi:hypothetical protein